MCRGWGSNVRCYRHIRAHLQAWNGWWREALVRGSFVPFFVRSNCLYNSFDLFFPIGACLMDYMRATGFHQFPAKPDEKSPFEYAHKSGFFEFLEKDREQRKYFDDFMSIRREGLVVWHETYPMADQLGPGADTDPEAVMLVDVGGGWGHDLKSFLKAHPGLSGRLILQDLPIIIDQVQSGSDSNGIELMSYDVFTPQPVKGTLNRQKSLRSGEEQLKFKQLQEHEHTTSTTSVTTGLIPNALDS